MIIGNIVRNKTNIILIPMLLSEVYFLKAIKMNTNNPIEIYASGLFNMYDKGILVAGFLLMTYLLISEFDKNMVVLRYKRKDLWIREIYITVVKKIALVVLIINLLPLVFAFTQITISTKDCSILLMYLINQIASFSILVFIYVFLFAVTHNKLYIFIGIFVGLYVPKFLLESIGRNYITPINMIFLNPNMKIGSMLVQTNIMIVIFVITAYIIESNIFKEKYNDIIWRV